MRKEEEKIVKEMKSGKCIYRNQQGEEISTYGETFDSLFRANIEPLRDFLNMTFDDDGAQRMAFIAKALLERVEEKLNVASEYIAEHCGSIEMMMADHFQGIVKPETIVDVVFEPCEKAKA